jgi:hypothetical protein
MPCYGQNSSNDARSSKSDDQDSVEQATSSVKVHMAKLS